MPRSVPAKGRTARVIPGAGDVPDVRNPDTTTEHNSSPIESDVRDGRFVDAESDYEYKGGSATSRLRWARESDEMADRNGPCVRDRGHRAV